MARADDIAKEALDVLFEEHESVTFRAGNVSALVDRIPASERDRRDQDPRVDSVVLFKTDDLSSLPTVGEIIEGTDGRSHRIRIVEPRGVSVACYCQTFTTA